MCHSFESEEDPKNYEHNSHADIEHRAVGGQAGKPALGNNYAQFAGPRLADAAERHMHTVSLHVPTTPMLPLNVSGFEISAKRAVPRSTEL